MGNALFYGALGFSIIILSGCIGIWLGKGLAKNKNTMSYEEMDAIEGEWYKEPPS